MLTPVCRDLRVEYLDAPIGIGTLRPRFSWTVTHVQTAFRLLVAAGKSVVWDTGRVESGNTSLHEYRGQSLRSNCAYTWQVTSWAADGTVVSASSSFETGLFAADWVATWVEPVQKPTTVERWTLMDWVMGQGPSTPAEDRMRPVQLLRQSFTLAAPPVKGRLYATAHGIYAATVNGRPADDQVLAPGFDSYTHRVSVQCYDVTALLHAGDNTLGVTLADGWWAGRIGISGSSAQFGDRTRAIWQLHIDLADGTSATVVSEPATVSSRPGPWRYADLIVGECFDASATVDGWDSPGHTGAGWTRVSDSGTDYSTLVPFSGEPIRRILELPARTVDATENGSVVDFGQVIAGRVRLRLRHTSPRQKMTIEHTEVLNPDGTWFQNILGANKEQTDIYLAAGAREETYEPTFTFHGFRYARITGVDALEPGDITAVVLSSDIPQTGEFHTSDERLNRLHQNVVWSQRANFLSVPTDCPQRERAGWTGDTQVFAPAACNNAIVAPFLSRWLDNLRADQLPSGEVPITSPRSPYDVEAAAAAEGIGSIVSAAGWSDAIAFVPWTLYERYGDRRVLEDNYDALLAWIEYQRATAAAHLPEALTDQPLSDEQRKRQELLYNTGIHFGDWLTPSTLAGDTPMFLAIEIAPKLTSEYIAPMFQAQTLTIAARLADVLGHHRQAGEFATRAAAVRDAFAAEYIDDHGDLPHRLQGLYVLALAFDIVPTLKRPYTAARLAELVTHAGDRLDTGFLSVPYLLDVLWDTGYRHLARRVLWQSEAPSWLYEVDHGATTIWETWAAVADDGTPTPVSMNHYAFGCVDDWLFRRVVGIRGTEAGYRNVVIEPDLHSDLTEVHAAIHTPAGRLSVDWTRTGQSAEVRVEVPFGVTATLVHDNQTTSLQAGPSTHTVELTGSATARAHI